MRKMFLMALLISVLNINVVIADDGSYQDTFRPMGGHKIRTNPIGQWFDDQVNKSYVQNKKQNVETKTNTNNGFSGYTNKNQYQPQPQKPVSNGGWSS